MIVRAHGRPGARRPPAWRGGGAILAGISLATGCMSLSPQLKPTDYTQLEQLESRGEREVAYTDNSIYVHQDARGVRYTKGDDPSAPRRSWQSLDVILRSDANSAAALPHRKVAAARILTALTVVSGLATAAGFVASAREGLDLSRISGGGAMLIAGGAVTLGLGIAAGVIYGRMRKDYERAVSIYNDSLGMRLGLYTPAGEYIPPRGVEVDSEGFVVLDAPEAQGPARASEPPVETTPAAAPEATPGAPPPTPVEGEGEAPAPEKAPEIQRPKTGPKPLVLLPLR